MDTTGLSFELANIVMLFKDLNTAKISRDTIFGLYPDLRPDHLDIGPLLVVRYPKLKLEIYLFLDENRVEVKLLAPSGHDWAELPKAASKVFGAIEGVPLTAFGFNYFAEVPVSKNQDGDQFLIDKFRTSLEPLAKQVEGEILSVSSVIRYSKNEEIHQLSLGAKSGNNSLLILRLNVEYNKTELFSEEDLKIKYSSRKDDFIKTIGRLFN